MTELIETLSPLLQIGFGAGLSALVAWMTMRSTHRHEYSRAVFDRKLQRLEEISNAVSDACAYSEKLAAAFDNACSLAADEGKEEASEEDFKRVRRLLDGFEDISDRLARAQNSARFIGAISLISVVGDLRSNLKNLATNASSRWELNHNSLVQKYRSTVMEYFHRSNDEVELALDRLSQ